MTRTVKSKKRKLGKVPNAVWAWLQRRGWYGAEDADGEMRTIRTKTPNGKYGDIEWTLRCYLLTSWTRKYWQLELSGKSAHGRGIYLTISSIPGDLRRHLPRWQKSIRASFLLLRATP